MQTTTIDTPHDVRGGDPLVVVPGPIEPYGGTLVDRRVDGRTTRCNLRAKPMQDAVEWVERYRDYWEDQLDQFARYIEDESNDPSKKDRKEENPE